MLTKLTQFTARDYTFFIFRHATLGQITLQPIDGVPSYGFLQGCRVDM